MSSLGESVYIYSIIVHWACGKLQRITFLGRDESLNRGKVDITSYAKVTNPVCARYEYIVYVSYAR